jgi:hypothetical protein
MDDLIINDPDAVCQAKSSESRPLRHSPQMARYLNDADGFSSVTVHLSQCFFTHYRASPES